MVRSASTTRAPRTTERTRTREPELRREQLLDAAEHVLLVRGIRGTTVADVADEAGVAKGTVYLYVRSKEELLEALRARYLDRYRDATSAPPEASSAEQVRHLVIGLYRFGAEHHTLHHLLFHEAGFSEDDAFSRVREQLISLIKSGMRSGDFKVSAADVGQAASFVLHGVHGALVEGMHEGKPTSTRAKAERVAALALRSLGASQ